MTFKFEYAKDFNLYRKMMSTQTNFMDGLVEIKNDAVYVAPENKVSTPIKSIKAFFKKINNFELMTEINKDEMRTSLIHLFFNLQHHGIQDSKFDNVISSNQQSVKQFDNSFFSTEPFKFEIDFEGLSIVAIHLRINALFYKAQYIDIGLKELKQGILKLKVNVDDEQLSSTTHNTNSEGDTSTLINNTDSETDTSITHASLEKTKRLQLNNTEKWNDNSIVQMDEEYLTTDTRSEGLLSELVQFEAPIHHNINKHHFDHPTEDIITLSVIPPINLEADDLLFSTPNSQVIHEMNFIGHFVEHFPQNILSHSLHDPLLTPIDLQNSYNQKMSDFTVAENDAGEDLLHSILGLFVFTDDDKDIFMTASNNNEDNRPKTLGLIDIPDLATNNNLHTLTLTPSDITKSSTEFEESWDIQVNDEDRMINKSVTLSVLDTDLFSSDPIATVTEKNATNTASQEDNELAFTLGLEKPADTGAGANIDIDTSAGAGAGTNIDTDTNTGAHTHPIDSHITHSDSIVFNLEELNQPTTNNVTTFIEGHTNDSATDLNHKTFDDLIHLVRIKKKCVRNQHDFEKITVLWESS